MDDGVFTADGDMVLASLRQPLPQALLGLAERVAATPGRVHGPDHLVELTQDAADDPLRRWEADATAESLRGRLADRVADSDRSVADVLSSPGPLVRARLDDEAADLWLEWLNRLYVAVRATELDGIAVGDGQPLDIQGSYLREPDVTAPPGFGPEGLLVGSLMAQFLDALDERDAGRG
ncbi:hypothetical protein ACFWVC_14120 [Streptomyces sp. NPDC058691]|uniref:hypothetical protein n=1 Tax=Streptomyces sp. NPDC058691 TaxID=3346601 RepID=UPI003668F65A